VALPLCSYPLGGRTTYVVGLGARMSKCGSATLLDPRGRRARRIPGLGVLIVSTPCWHALREGPHAFLGRFVGLGDGGDQRIDKQAVAGRQVGDARQHRRDGAVPGVLAAHCCSQSPTQRAEDGRASGERSTTAPAPSSCLSTWRGTSRRGLSKNPIGMGSPFSSRFPCTCACIWWADSASIGRGVLQAWRQRAAERWRG